jgi:Amt family ammonium transporter
VHWKGKTTIDDTLDVFPCHGIGGIVGMIMTGVFSSKAINAVGTDGLIYGGTDFFLKQVAGCGIVVAFSLIMGFILFKIVDLLNPIRVTLEEEEIGLDVTQHAESL